MKGEKSMRGKIVISAVVGAFILLLGLPVIPASSQNAALGEPTPEVPPSVWLPKVLNNWCAPAVEFTYVPPYKTREQLQGKVRCVKPENYKLAVYIFVSGWWTKPYWAWPLTDIQSDGSWSCNIGTGGSDELATKIAAFLVPTGYQPPLAGGEQTLPAELYANAVAYVTVDREPDAK
ncbi:MAG: hypothetical protein Q8N84_02625 [bacterium]|nr:hypothetical protein [bacterium]